MQEVQVERKYQSAEAAVTGFKKLAPVKEFADIYVTKDLNDLQSMGVAPFTVQEIVESVNSEQTGCETEHEVKVYKLIDATEEVWIRAEVHLNHSEIEEV
jgi:hypothetical protein